MKFSEIKLPSNRKFGLFFSGIFLFLGWYFYDDKSSYLSIAFLIISSVFFTIAIFKAELLLSLNKLWMRFGLLLSIIVSPLIMGIIFFGIFTPISILMKLFGRDELKLKIRSKSTFWKYRTDKSILGENFKRQF